MSAVQKILTTSLVKEFYRENAGVFVFFFTVMFGVVGILHNATFWTYHYLLIMGMLNNPGIFIFILTAWFLYARKCAAFVIERMRSPAYSFIHILTRMDNRSLWKRFVVTQILLYLPVLIYTVFIFIVACYHHYFISIMIIAVFHWAVCYGASILYRFQLMNPEAEIKLFPKVSLPTLLQRSYLFLLFRYMLSDLKMIILGIKIFTCGILYLLALNNTGNYYDLQFPFLFFSFGILANGIVIHRVREFEERQVSFYRGLPLSLGIRFIKYIFLYLVYFIPEAVTILIIIPDHLHFADGVTFLLCGYALLMMMNSVSFIGFFEMKFYLRIILLLYALVYLFTATLQLTSLYIVLFSISAFLFFVGYYRYEHTD